ncbi:MAG: hypothetical protein JWM30_1855 [Burkholderia sp.]|nr:hypothetical protein [Burkholderia sp.]
MIWKPPAGSGYTSGMSAKTSALRRWTTLLARGLGVLALSLLLHWLALHWAGRHIGLPSSGSADAPAVTVQLRPPPALAPAPPVVAAAPKPPRPRKRRPAAVAPVAPTPAVVSAPEPSTVETPPEIAAAPAAGTPSEAAAPEPAPAEQAAAPAEAPPYRFRMPPSVELKYDVQALRDGKIVYGSGKISWRADAGRYQVDGEASVLFFTVLNFQSVGAVDEFGVAPELYSEKRFRRPENVTRFERGSQRIRFSGSDASFPRADGAQDRASIVWQLAAIGLGDPGRYAPGAAIELFVAGVRDAEPWVIQVIGLEQTETPAGSTEAWHVVRAPRSGSHDQKLDIWLAPQHWWYPVRLRFTETNGEYLDMAVTSVQSLTPI